MASAHPLRASCICFLICTAVYTQMQRREFLPSERVAPDSVQSVPMGSVSSICKCRKRPKPVTLIHDQFTQTRYAPPGSMARPYSHRTDTPFRLTVLDKSPSTRRHFPTPRPSAVGNQRYHHPPPTRTIPIQIQSRQEPHVEAHQPSPANVFLIDISNKQVRVGQPVSIHIRHLVMDPSDYLPAQASATDALECIADACDSYPNPTTDVDQTTRKTIHAYFRA